MSHVQAKYYFNYATYSCNKKVLTVYAVLVLARHNSHAARNEMRGHRGNLHLSGGTVTVVQATEMMATVHNDGYCACLE